MTNQADEEFLLLKWGTVKGWDHLSEKSQGIMRRYFADGISMSCVTDKPNEKRKDILCELIDQLNGAIWNDWSGKKMTPDEAKAYVREYGQPVTQDVQS